MTMLRIADWSTLNETERKQLLARPAVAATRAQSARVAEIIAQVRADGDAAIVRLTHEIDGIEIDAIPVAAAELAAAGEQLSPAQKAAIQTAAANIETFHALQRPAEIDIETMPGVRCQRVTRPIRRVGLYVPAGTAPLPSTALMLGVPSRLAGCPVRVLCCPPGRNGKIDPTVLYAARIAGIDQVFCAGGAQAVAAMAYGTESIPKVDKIYGPGNAWVTEAKTQVDLDPDGAAKDYPAGPSEVLVIADAAANPEFAASDLLSQAEHGPDSQVLLLTTDPEFANQVAEATERQTQSLPRRDIVEQSLAHAAIIVVRSTDEAIAISNRYAPEHLILQIADARERLDSIECAGSVFVGPWTPESVGDYCSGTNHVLPTYGYASRYSSLGLSDFLRSMTVQELTPDGLRAIAPTAITLAESEGLDAHARAVGLRVSSMSAGQQA